MGYLYLYLLSHKDSCVETNIDIFHRMKEEFYVFHVYFSHLQRKSRRVKATN
jgi:hypothetical protein